MQVKKVGSIGERGISTNIVTYNTLDTLVAMKGKGVTDAGSPAIEVAEDLTDAGQTAMATAGAPGVQDSYAFKILRTTGDIEYMRGVVAGPVSNGGRNEDFVLNTYTLGLNQVPLKVSAA